MDRPFLRRVAQVSWFVPLLFVGLSIHQAKVVYDLERTRGDGVSATADVLEIHKDDRKDVTYDYVSLRVNLSPGDTITRRQMSLPHGLVPPLLDREMLDVRVSKGASIPIVITETIGSTPVVQTQAHIAGMNALMSFGAALLFGVGVWYWNRSLRREGDPADRGIEEADPNHPARKVVRS